MTIQRVTALTYALLPHAINLRQSKALIASIEIVEFLTTVAGRFAATQSWDNGEAALELEVTAPSNCFDALFDKLFAQNAKFCVISISSGSGYDSKVRMLFPESVSHERGGNISLPNNLGDGYWDYVYNVSSSLQQNIIDLIDLNLALDGTDSDAVVWFADRLPTDEIRGPHMLALQNFLYRRTLTKQG